MFLYITFLNLPFNFFPNQTLKKKKKTLKKEYTFIYTYILHLKVEMWNSFSTLTIQHHLITKSLFLQTPK